MIWRKNSIYLYLSSNNHENKEKLAEKFYHRKMNYFRISELLLLVTVVLFVRSNEAKQPNIVFLLTDDQDTQLGGEVIF